MCLNEIAKHCIIDIRSILAGTNHKYDRISLREDGGCMCSCSKPFLTGKTLTPRRVLQNSILIDLFSIKKRSLLPRCIELEFQQYYPFKLGRIYIIQF